MFFKTLLLAFGWLMNYQTFPKISVNILTKNRSGFLDKAISSVMAQSFKDFEIVVVNDGSTDGTRQILENFQSKNSNFKLIDHRQSLGITAGRQEALLASTGEYIALLDDDDEWLDRDKLKKQAEFLDKHPGYVLVGGGIKISNVKIQIAKFRPQTDESIRHWMLLKNPFFTSTVMFRKTAAFKAGGFVKDEIDLAEDYDLWLRLGKIGKMRNFREVFTAYAQPVYNKEKLGKFYKKQSKLIVRHKSEYHYFWLARFFLWARQLLLKWRAS